MDAMEQSDLNKELRAAVQDGNVDVINRLIEKGAQVKAHGGIKEQTPLHIAAIKGNDAIVKTLFDLNADINAVAEEEHSGGTALHWAAYSGHESTIKLLMELGCDPATPNAKGMTAKQTAEANGNASCAALLP